VLLNRALAAVHVLVLATSVSGCMLFDFMFDPPGKGAAAERGYALSAPLIEALEKYRVDHARYPASLSVLSPTYVRIIPEEEIKDGRLEYLSRGDRYELSFTYGPPGRNICVYRSAETQWSCYGYY